jgi:hypothetical protein
VTILFFSTDGKKDFIVTIFQFLFKSDFWSESFLSPPLEFLYDSTVGRCPQFTKQEMYLAPVGLYTEEIALQMWMEKQNGRNEHIEWGFSN